MRIRSIKPELWTDALTGEWDARLTLFFIGIWQVADDAGRLRLDSRLIRADLDPFDTKFGGIEGITQLLGELVRMRRVLPYEADGQRLGLVAGFARHQRINKPTPSRLPEPPEGLRESYRNPTGGLPRNEAMEQGAGKGAGSEDAAARAEGEGSAFNPDTRRSPGTDAAKRRTFPISDLTELGPLGAEYRGRLERELGRGLAGAAPERAAEVRADLERLLERHGVERALAWTVTTLEARRRSRAPEVVSVSVLPKILGSMPDAEPGALERVRRACPEWGRVLDAAMALPPGNAPTEYQLQDVLLPLQATFLRGELTLEAPDEGRARFVDEVFGEGLRQLALEAIGPHVLVHVRAQGAAEAGR